MNRRNRILAAVLAVQIVIAALVFVPRLIPTSTGGAPLFGTLKAADIVGFTVQDTTGSSVEVSKQNDAWVLPASDNYPANKSDIESFLDKVVALKTDALVTRTSASHKQLQVADDTYARRIDLKLADGSTRTLLIGSASGASASYVRAGGQDAVYLAPNIASYSVGANASTWLSTSVYLSFAQDKVTAMTLQNAQGNWSFTKDAQNQWAMAGLSAGDKFNPDSVTMLLATLSNTPMLQPLGKANKPEYGLDKPQAVMTFMIQDSITATARTITLSVGAKDPKDNSYVMISSESPYYVRVAQFTAEGLVTKKRDDFMATPTPAVQATPIIITETPTPAATSTLTATTPTTTTTPSPAATPTPQPTP